MAKSKYDVYYEVLDALDKGLSPYILKAYKDAFGNEAYLREMERKLGGEKYSPSFPDETSALAEIDAAGWLNLLDRNWDRVFRGNFPKSAKAVRSYVNELIATRNDFSHPKKSFEVNEVARFAETASLLFKAIGTVDLADFANRLAQELRYPHVETSHKRTPPRDPRVVSMYGVKLYWADRSHETVVGFSTAGYERWKDSIVPGTRMLIYETSRARGAQAIVSEVKVVEGFEKSAGLPTPTVEHEHPVRVEVIHRKGSVPLIPRDMVQIILEREHYPLLTDTWVPISEEQYQEFMKFWGVR
jgi:hypothetical protein